MHFVKGLGAALFAGSFLAACGGGGGSSGSATTAPTTTQTTTTQTGRTFAVTPVAGFSIAGGVPNAALIDGKVTLIYTTPSSGLCEAVSADGTTFTGLGVASQRLNTVLAPIGANGADVIVRQTASGKKR